MREEGEAPSEGLTAYSLRASPEYRPVWLTFAVNQPTSCTIALKDYSIVADGKTYPCLGGAISREGDLSMGAAMAETMTVSSATPNRSYLLFNLPRQAVELRFQYRSNDDLLETKRIALPDGI